MTLITVNPMKSTTIGGVETLIRDLQLSYSGAEIIELYEKTPWQEDFSENSNVNYIRFGLSEKNGLVNKVRTKLNQKRNIEKAYSQDRKNTIVLFHPNDLLYIPKKIRKQAKIILVQTNRLDIFFSDFSRVVMRLISQDIDIFTVYTDIDKSSVNKSFGKWFKKIEVIPRGCKLNTSKNLKSAGKKLVTIARIHEHQKNFSGMVDIIRHLPKDYSLDIYGNGPDAEIASLKRLIDRYPQITLKGSTADVAKTLSGYSLFIMTSHYEGFGQTLIEARSQGLPIVAYNTFDALSWIVENEKNGFTVTPYEAATFANKIKIICSDDEIYKKLSSSALLKAKETERVFINSKWQEVLTND